jgi:hypothetical protein
MNKELKIDSINQFKQCLNIQILSFIRNLPFFDNL